MRLLIDSHALIWYVDQHHQLSSASHVAMSDPANDLLLSAGSIWEIAIKIGLGKLILTEPYLPGCLKLLVILALRYSLSPLNMPMCKRISPNTTMIRLIG